MSRSIAGARLAHLADVLLGPIQPIEDIARRRQQPLAGGSQDQPLADAQEERRAQPRFDVAELVAERGLCEVEPIARAREATEFRDGRYQAEMADFEIHRHENIFIIMMMTKNFTHDRRRPSIG